MEKNRKNHIRNLRQKKLHQYGAEEKPALATGPVLNDVKTGGSEGAKENAQPDAPAKRSKARSSRSPGLASDGGLGGLGP